MFWKSPAFWYGLSGAIVAVLLCLLLYGEWVQWNRARNGEMAFEYLQKMLEQQQQTQAPQPRPPVK